METIYECPFCGTILEESYDKMTKGQMTATGRLYCKKCKCDRVTIKVYFTDGEVQED